MNQVRKLSLKRSQYGFERSRRATDEPGSKVTRCRVHRVSRAAGPGCNQLRKSSSVVSVIRARAVMLRDNPLPAAMSTSSMTAVPVLCPASDCRARIEAIFDARSASGRLDVPVARDGGARRELDIGDPAAHPIECRHPKRARAHRTGGATPTSLC